MKKEPVKDRLAAKMKLLPNGCRIFTAGCTKEGYGRIQGVGRGNTRLAHNVTWELVNGPIPCGMKVCHTCDNPPCCEISHLFLGTSKDNSKDMVQKGRQSKGENHYNAKLKYSQVAEIRANFQTGTYSYKKLGEHYGVTSRQIGNIVKGRSWTT